ncbi:MAG: D-alanyl-D-alanine carboxypeptidase/D-alanyl-D-alanine-endopeptidase [Methylophilaceae bacterium]
MHTGLLRLFCLSVLLWLSAAHAELPEAVNKALQAEGVPPGSVSVFVQQLDQHQPVINHHADQALNPASTMKLLTTYAGLDLLGPAYRWRTEAYYDGSLRDGVLKGNLILKGYGDPALMTEDFWRLLSSLRQAGVKDIRGDLVLDTSYFAAESTNPGAFDNEPYRAYNAMPSALLVNLKSTSFRLEPGMQGGGAAVRVLPEPDLPEMKIINHLKLVQSGCGDWKNRLDYAIKPQGHITMVTFSGTYAADCGEKYLELSVFDDAAYTFNLFRKLWQQLGGSLQGTVRQAATPVNAVKLAEQSSMSLADVIRRINKYSNNLMARQLLLTIAAEREGVPATEVGGDKAIRAWLASKGWNFPELVIENGAGLSRIERISAKHLGELLMDAYFSPVMPELMSSLPVLSVDGTVGHRLKDSPAQGRAHLKTGSLDGVRSIAGYVLDQKGRRWVVVFMANHPRAGATRNAQDALLDWVYQHE